MTSPLKNTIPTLVFLSIILVLSGCVGKAIDGAINRATNSAKNFVENGLDGLDGLDGIDIDDIDGSEELTRDDPCLRGNAVFTNDVCNGDTKRITYNSLREARCIQDNDAFLCAATTRRICETEADLDHVLCKGAVYDLLRTQRDVKLEAERQSVVIADWTNGTADDGVVGGLNAEPNPAHTGNQFLSGLHGLGALPTSDQVQASDLTPEQKAKLFVVSNRSDRGTLTLGFEQSQITNTDGTRPAFAVFKGIDENGDETSAGDARDGVVFVSGLYTQQTGCTGSLCSINRHYAGLLPTTDLGSPLTESLAQGTWQGWIQARGDVFYNQRFDLTITFDESTDGGTIAAYVADAITALKIDGVFNNHGFVTGDILHGDIAPDSQIGDNKSPGQLRGLIGDEGAVVAFISDATGPRTDDAPAQYSGGFVAYLVNPEPQIRPTTIPQTSDPCVLNATCVDYAYWVAAAEPTDAPMPNQFLKGTATGLMGVMDGDLAAEGAGSLADPRLRAGGEAADGFAIYRPIRTGSVHNVGILSTTRLGAPLSEAISKAKWPGVLHERSGTDAITTSPITLTVDFNTGSDTGTINGINGMNADGLYEIIANFSDVGVINGTIIRTAKSGETITGADSGRISGLIGADGAVAVFRSGASATVSFVGGFVAQPPVVVILEACITENTCVDYAHWVAAANPADAPTPNQFLKGTPTGLSGVTVAVDVVHLNVKNITDHYNLDEGETADGFAIYRPINPHSSGSLHNVGIYSTTRLGAPLSETVTNAQWPGRLQYRVRQGGAVDSRNITLIVGFNANTDVGTITISGGTDYEIDAGFNDMGVISGGITRRVTTPTADTSTGTISGLIGVDGAVGVFRSNAGQTTSYVGGFVASPPASGS